MLANPNNCHRLVSMDWHAIMLLVYWISRPSFALCKINSILSSFHFCFIFSILERKDYYFNDRAAKILGFLFRS